MRVQDKAGDDYSGVVGVRLEYRGVVGVRLEYRVLGPKEVRSGSSGSIACPGNPGQFSVMPGSRVRMAFLTLFAIRTASSDSWRVIGSQSPG